MPGSCLRQLTRSDDQIGESPRCENVITEGSSSEEPKIPTQSAHLAEFGRVPEVGEHVQEGFQNSVGATSVDVRVVAQNIAQ